MSEYIIVRKPKKRRFRKEEPTTEFSLVDVLRQQKEETKALEDFLKEQEKLNKKDDKKEMKAHQFTFTEGMLLAFFAQYLLGGPLSMMLKAYGVH